MAAKYALIDGYGFIFRAYHSLPPLTRAHDSMPIGAVYGFTNMLLRLINHTQDKNHIFHGLTHIAVALDSKEPTFRKDIYPLYKANRPPAPPELVVQLPIIKDVLDAFNIRYLVKPGYEADDIIATYTQLAGKDEVIIISSDKDLTQLLGENVRMYDPLKEREITHEYVLEKFGVLPNKIREALSMIGDSSDNIPGAHSIGPKTASELLNKYGSLEGIYQHIDELPTKRKDALINDKNNVYLSYKLIGLSLDAITDVSLEDLKLKEIEPIKVRSFLENQGFQSLLNRVKKEEPKVKATPITISDLKKYIDEIFKIGIIYFYIDQMEILVSIGDKNFIITLNESHTLFKQEGMLVEDFINILSPVLLSDSVIKVTQNSKWLYKRNLQFQHIEDIQIMAYALEVGRNVSSLETILSDYISDLGSYTKSQLLKFGYNHFKNKLFENKNIALYEHIDRLMPKVIARMESIGVKIDIPYLALLTEEFTQKMQLLEKQIYEIAGKEFNIGSTKQLSEILFNELKIPYGKKSKSGNYSTSANFLNELEEQGFEIATIILKWRQYSKLLSTYTSALPRVANPLTKRIHSHFSLTLTATGRLSSTEPNLQNIPIRSEEGHRVRNAFIADEGNVILSADYSQIELRLLANYAKIQPLIEAFKHNLDIHAITASQIFHIPLAKVNADLRRQAKTINFGIIYGISAFGLAKRLDISQKEAQDYIDKYFKQYSGIKDYMNSTIEFAQNHGYVHNIFGRKCLISGINSPRTRGFAQRAAINAPLQSSAADIIKKAMASLPLDLAQYMILQIHDELLFEVPSSQAQEIGQRIKRVMENVVALEVPLTVEVKYGRSWGEAAKN